MPPANNGVNNPPPPSAAGAPPAPQTNLPAQAAGEGKPSNTPSPKTDVPQGTIPYSRFQEVVEQKNQYAETLEQLQYEVQQLRSQLKPGNTPPVPSSSPPSSYEDDPIGYLRRQVEDTQKMLAELHQNHKATQGEKLVQRLKEANPIFAHEKWGAEAMMVLEARLAKADGMTPPARIVREVAEKFSTLAVADAKAPHQVAVDTARAVGIPPTSTPAVGAATEPPAKPRSFDDAAKAARVSGRWESIAQRFGQVAQV